MSYAEPWEGATRLKIEEWVRWGGDGEAHNGVRSNASIWGRLVMEFRRGEQAPIKVIGREAGFTDEARKRIGDAFWLALTAFYLEGDSVRRAAAICRVSKSEMDRRLVKAHAAFWDERDRIAAQAESSRAELARRSPVLETDEYARAKEIDRSVEKPGPLTRI